jgi:large subunit ribosomal protein L21
MFAVVNIGGKQYRVAEKDTLFIPYTSGANQGDTLQFSEVLLLADGDKVKVGRPHVDGAQVSGEVLQHVRGDKIIVFKKKRRKRYKVKRGHRQRYTQIRISSLSAGETD